MKEYKSFSDVGFKDLGSTVKVGNTEVYIDSEFMIGKMLSEKPLLFLGIPFLMTVLVIVALLSTS